MPDDRSTLWWGLNAVALVARSISMTMAEDAMNERGEIEHGDHEALGSATDALRSATGWYLDPYHLHELRWISGGRATRLVRDGSVTTNEEPPTEPFQGELVLPDEVPVRHETIRAGDDADPNIGPIVIVYNSSM